MKKRYRVKDNETIKTILKRRDARKDGYFSIFKAPNTLPHFRYALSVPKTFGSAVKRNKIKRQLRMIIAEMDVKQSYDIFIIVQAKTQTLDYWSMKTRLETLLKKHKLI